MPEVDLRLIGEQLDRVLREQTGLRDENREIRAALGAIARKFDGFAEQVGTILDEVALFNIRVRVLDDRVDGLKAHIDERFDRLGK